MASRGFFFFGKVFGFCKTCILLGFHIKFYYALFIVDVEKCDLSFSTWCSLCCLASVHGFRMESDWQRNAPGREKE